jgi:hypothetical protein
MFIDDGVTPERGEMLFSAIVWATYPTQAEYEIKLVDMGEAGCRAVLTHENLIAAYPVTREECETFIAAFHAITQSAPTQIHDAQGVYSES